MLPPPSRPKPGRASRSSARTKIPRVVLAPGTARRRALDDALAEIATGLREPSQQWKVRYGLMLGLERVLSAKPPSLATGLELRRHQIDALAGMLTELIAANQREDEPRTATATRRDELDEEDEELEAPRGRGSTTSPRPLTPEEDPGAVRRFRFRHPTASGKTVAAAGFVEAARSLGVLILTHRRLLVTQFQRDLTDNGYRDRFTDAILGAHDGVRRRRRRSRSRPTPGSRATPTTSRATPTSS